MPVSSLPFLSFLAGAVALDQTPALCDDKSEKWTSYGDLRAGIKDLLPFWQSSPRSLVLCAAPRTISGALAILSAAEAGHALLLIDPGVVRLAPFVTAYEPEWVVLPSATKPGDLYDPVDWPLEELTLWHRATQVDKDIHPDLFLLLLPPAPEGSVKTVRLSYTNIASNVNASVEALNVTPQDRILLPLPLGHSSGLSALFSLLAVGGSVLLTEQDIKSRSFWEQAMQREVTHFLGVPFHFDYIAKAGLEHLHAPRIKSFWQAGGRMPTERLQEILRQITERKGTFFILYGQTEASPRMTALPLHEKPEKIGSFGQPIQGSSLAVEDGEIVYTGPNVMMGYAQERDDLAKGDERNGRLVTGDQGYLDEEGYLFLIGK